jgi:hypothetical protein
VYLSTLSSYLFIHTSRGLLVSYISHELYLNHLIVDIFSTSFFMVFLRQCIRHSVSYTAIKHCRRHEVGQLDEALRYKAEGGGVDTRRLQSFISIYPFLLAALGSAVCLLSTTNDYQKQEKCSYVVESGRRVKLTSLPSSVS